MVNQGTNGSPDVNAVVASLLTPFPKLDEYEQRLSLEQYRLLAVGRPDQNVINELPSANLRRAAFDGKRLRVTVEWLWRSSIGMLSKVAIATRRNAQEPHECASHRIDAAETRSEGHMLKPVISAF